METWESLLDLGHFWVQTWDFHYFALHWFTKGNIGVLSLFEEFASSDEKQGDLESILGSLMVLSPKSSRSRRSLLED